MIEGGIGESGEMTSRQAWLRISEDRVAFGIAGISAIIVAASISALPAASCTAIAETYGRAITDFGVAAVFALCSQVFVPTDAASSKSGRWFQHIWRVSDRLMLLVACLLLALAILTSTQNLKSSVRFCFVGTTSELAIRSHQHLPLYGSRTFWKMFGEPVPRWEN